MPVSTPASFSTTRRRTWLLDILAVASARTSSSFTLSTSPTDMASEIGESKLRPSATTRRTISRSVTRPITLPSSTTGTTPLSM